MRLAILTAHAGADSLSAAVLSWTNALAIGALVANGQDGMLDAYEAGYLTTDADILAYFHDDLIIHDSNWTERVFAEFEDPRVGLVGFGGALGHGSPELYKVPYDYHQLGRSQFLSNMDDAEVHGKRFTGSTDVAVLDGFALIFRRSVLEEIGGWHPETPAQYIAYDYAACCRVRRAGYRIRVVGVSVSHLGGRTFVKLGLGKGPENWTQFFAAHEYIYNEFRDVLPFSV